MYNNPVPRRAELQIEHFAAQASALFACLLSTGDYLRPSKAK
jgi:hypothetical protein